MSVKYRPEIDGLRAIAVLAVVFFHTKILGFNGGYVGVDVFFVISGYLITSIILQESQLGSFSILNFYKRRIRRILPLAIVVCLVAFVIAYCLFDTLLYRSNTHVIKRSLLFISNFVLAHKTGYFEPAASDNLLLHSWSLSIEEQFYILFPICFVLLFTYARSTYKKWWVAVVVVSFITNIIVIDKDPLQAFYWPVSRVWELLSGSLLAIGVFPVIQSKWVNQILSAIGASLLIAIFFLFDDTLKYPSWYALLPVFAAMLIIHAAHSKDTWVHRLLTTKPLLFTGKISYSIYMWHWPLYLLLLFLSLHTPTLSTKLLFISGIYALSCLSYFFIERQFRKNTVFMNKKGPYIILFCLAITYGIIKLSSNGNNSICKAEYAQYEKRLQEKRALMNKKKVTVVLTPKDTLMVLHKFGDKDSLPRILLYGDSHALALSIGLDSLSKSLNTAVYSICNPGYPPFNDVYIKGQEDFTIRANRIVLDFVNKHPELKTIILTARWTCYNPNDRISYRKFAIEGRGEKGYTKKFAYAYGLKRTVDSIVEMGRNVIITLPVPEIRQDIIRMLVIQKLFHTPADSFAMTIDEYRQSNQFILSLLDAYKTNSQVKIVDITSPLLSNGRYKIIDNNHQMYTDNNHLSIYGASIAATSLKEYIAR